MDFVTTLEELHFGKWLITFFVSMVPVVELRGAIPVGVSLGLGHLQAMLVSMAGNLVPVPFIVLFVRRVFQWIREKIPRLERLVTRLETRAREKGQIVHRWAVLGLAMFVAIPLPGTGAWTGALIAALLNIRLKEAFPAIVLGVLVAGLLVTGLTFGFTEIF